MKDKKSSVYGVLGGEEDDEELDDEEDDDDYDENDTDFDNSPKHN